MKRKMMKCEGGDWVVALTSSGSDHIDSDGDNHGGRVIAADGGDKRMTKGGKTLSWKRPCGASRACSDEERDSNQVGRLGLAGKVGKRGIKLFGNSRERNRALTWSLREQLKSVKGWMEKVGEMDHNVTIISEYESNATIRRRNRNNADAGQSSMVNVEEAKASKKAFDGCMILLGKILKHISCEMYGAKIVEKRMNLGFIKTKPKSNAYEHPSQFAEEMRLRFNSAMAYSSPGRIVHDAAKVLLDVFDDRWVAIETEYSRGVKLAHQPHHQASSQQGSQEL